MMRWPSMVMGASEGKQQADAIWPLWQGQDEFGSISMALYFRNILTRFFTLNDLQTLLNIQNATYDVPTSWCDPISPSTAVTPLQINHYPLVRDISISVQMAHSFAPIIGDKTKFIINLFSK